tara:strand:+ start:10505 stop:11098 length:594 start_codon:yes stop_codon:yes gene_type:complete
LENNKELLIATSNAGKVKEFNKIFKNHKLFSLTDLGIKDPVEDGDSFLENALIKAKHGAMISKKFTIADDSGLVVPGLDFEPGIYSARYAGDRSTDKDNRDKIIKKLNELNLKELDAYYVCVLVGIRNYLDPMPIITQGKINGKVSIESSGDGGFGYDKIFYPLNYDCSMASLGDDIKNKISHRGVASEKFIKIYNS